MLDVIKSASYSASQNLSIHGLFVKRSLLKEALSALLGYSTLAALQHEESDPSLLYHLEDAETLILNIPMARTRATSLLDELAGGEIGKIVNVCMMSLKNELGRFDVFDSVADFYDSHGREALVAAINDSEDVAIGMAECNALFPDDPYLPDACPETEDLWSNVDEWRISAGGEMKGTYDQDGDRMFNGNTLKVSGTLIYQKAGRAGLIFLDSEGYGGVDDSWRDADREAEYQYWLSQMET